MSPHDHLVDLAKKLAGNHRKFQSFAWSERPEDDANWCIVYTTNRDADALTRSNAHVIRETMNVHDESGDCRSERHSHWACGWVDGYAIRVYDSQGQLTPAFIAYAELALQLEEYGGALDEDHFSQEEEEEEANEVWANCYRPKSRIEYIRAHRSQFEFRSFADMLGSVRGRYFGGYASDLVHS